MRRIAFPILILIALASCTKREAMLSSRHSIERDSLALRVAVLPVMDCLPIFYAQRMGYFDSAGVDVRLLEYRAEMDLDTALARRRAHLGYTSLPRLLMMDREGDTLLPLAALPGRLALLTAHSKRIRNLKQLNERMVGIDRHSAADYWSDQLMQEAGLPQSAIYRPQFNDLALRASMLTNQLIDAALLPEPFATQVWLQGNRKIYETPDSAPPLQCLAMPKAWTKDSLRTRQQRQFAEAYNRAARQLNESPQKDSLRNILRQDYGQSDAVIDSLRLPHFPSLAPPDAKARKQAEDWLNDRLKIK